MTETVQAYPLQWPMGWKRATPGARTDAKFVGSVGHWTGPEGARKWVGKERVTLGQGIKRVMRELRAFGVRESSIVISSDLRLRLDGIPYAGQATSRLDPGVAVYWQEGKRQRCIAVDRYRRIEDNLAAIAATLEAMRAIERHGGAEILDRAFTGFAALPAPEQWFQVLGVSATASRAEIDAAYKRLAMQNHPDRPGGSEQAMARINAARDDGYAQREA